MLRLPSSILLIIFFFLASTVSVFSQKQNPKKIYSYGAFVSAGVNIHSPSFRRIEGINSCCSEFASGNGFGFAIGALFEYALQEKFYLTARTSYQTLGGKISKEESIGNTQTLGGNSTEPVMVDHVVDASISAINIEPGIKYNFGGKVYATLGMNFMIISNAKFDAYEEIISPSTVVFKGENTKRRNEYTGLDIPQKKSLALSGTIGIGYEIDFSFGSISPELRYTLPFSFSEIDWNVSPLHLLLAFRMHSYEEQLRYMDKLEYQRDTVQVDRTDIAHDQIKLLKTDTLNKTMKEDDLVISLKIIKESYLKENVKILHTDANLIVYGVSADGKKQEKPVIIIEEIESEEVFPLLPYVFFKENDDLIRSTSQNLLTKDQTKNFNENNLAWHTMEIYSEMINIIGKRMNIYPNAKLTITGCNKDMGVEKSNKKLSKRRAQSVKDYLANVWSIAPSRMRLTARNLPVMPGSIDHIDGQTENQRVELSANKYEIIAPVRLKDIVRKSNPPTVEIIPSTSGDEWELKDWSIKISQDNKDLRNYHYSFALDTVVWETENKPIPLTEKDVNISFVTRNSNNKIIQTEQKIEIRQKTIKTKREVFKDDKIVEQYALIVFDYNMSNLKKNHLKMLDEIKKKITLTTEVKISGYADRTGDYDYNEELAMRRINEVEKYLKINPKKIIKNAVGSKQLLFNNEIPEGRHYCRTVIITLETPIK